MPLFPIILLGYGGAAFSETAASATVSASGSGNILLAILVSLCLMQLFIILGLRGSRNNFWQYEQRLKARYRALEQRLLDRSLKLRTINNQLYEAIAKHEATEKLLNETQGNLQNIINSMPSILIGVTPEGIISHWNTAAEEATGINHTEALNLELATIAPDLSIDAALIKKAVASKKPQKFEGRQQGHGSQTTYTDLTIYPLLSSDTEGAVIRIDDVTLRVQLENMMIQNEKMNSLGEMAAGVAHEINNPMGTIIQTIQNIKRRISPVLDANQITAKELDISLEDINHYLDSRQITEFLEDIKDAGERAASIVTNMLEFSRAQNMPSESIKLVEILDRSIKLAHQTIIAASSGNRQRVKISKIFPEHCPGITCSPIEIQQVLLNLISNAFHAFEEKQTKQCLSIEVKLAFTETEAHIYVKDDGPGMDAWTQKHIFDPFFTTKEVGKGTGLGLSVSYFIITERHRGTISVSSQKQQGTTFFIGLPLD
ncbi:MAG: PAS domain-containing protein [Cellvibrionaceae bacterium]|nr:PAS domain-containing protein [Cellvibrionaceae bacterium]